jgi:hypothetical protein
VRRFLSWVDGEFTGQKAAFGVGIVSARLIAVSACCNVNLGGVMTKSNTARSLRADDGSVLAAIEFTSTPGGGISPGCAREPRDANGAAAMLTPAYAKWRAVQDDICQDWDRAYTLMLATRPTTATGATALIGAFLQYERALGTELENVAPLLQSLLAFLEGCEAAKAGRHRTLSPRRNEMQA